MFCKMDLLIKTAIRSEVTSDFHIEPDGEGSMFSYNFNKFLSLQNDAFSEFGLHENVKLNLAILNRYCSNIYTWGVQVLRHPNFFLGNGSR